ncbi:hypothetical protein ACPPVQ_18785 [Diaminobutyricibacter sp. McL0618]|uniref:hypothetical protein n=1 Tax=Leifsonia sp. McL0618 TaxID=3415677 RepID=UPI003CEC589A
MTDSVHLVDGWGIASSLASVVTALAVVFAVGQLRVARQQSHRDFENLYVRRYWDLLDQFSDQATLDKDLSSWGSDDLTIALNYIRLCEDEVDMRRLGRITNSTWAFWGPAISQAMTEPAYVALRIAHPAQFASLREFLSSRHDPFTKSRIGAWLGGL